MELLAKLLFIVGALPAAGGTIILVLLAPQPRTIEDHLLGAARYLMLGGATFGAAAAVTGTAPSWHAVAFMVGVGAGMTLHARRNHLLALAREKLDDGQESGV